jgi:hypothetical protein
VAALGALSRVPVVLYLVFAEVITVTYGEHPPSQQNGKQLRQQPQAPQNAVPQV